MLTLYVNPVKYMGGAPMLRLYGAQKILVAALIAGYNPQLAEAGSDVL